MPIDKQTIGLITGIILMILGFISFTAIGIANRNNWMNLTIHIYIVAIGFILIIIAVIIFYFCTKDEKRKQLKKPPS